MKRAHARSKAVSWLNCIIGSSGCQVMRQAARSIPDLQRRVDRFVVHYNERRSHSSRTDRPPKEAFDALDEAGPGDPVAGARFRVRTDQVDSCGKVTLRHDSQLFHIAIGRRWQGSRIRLYAVDLDVRVVTFDGQLLRPLTLDTRECGSRQNSLTGCPGPGRDRLPTSSSRISHRLDQDVWL